jgi:hypothetical protein
LVDVVALSNIAVQHAADEVNALFAQNIGDAQIAVHDLVDAVERILLVDNSVKENTECPYVLLCTPIRLASENFRSGVI